MNPIATKIVDDALALQYSISVDDGGDTFIVRKCIDRAQILAALDTSDINVLYFYDVTTSRCVGWAQLVNSGIADASDNPKVDAILKGAEALSDQLEEAA